MDTGIALLALGRLDGRLLHSPAAQPWLIKARLEGAAKAACNASVPVTVHDLQAWLSGTRNPPRSSEGLNDPLSVAAVVYFFFATLDQARGHNDRAVTRLLRALLDVDVEAQVWAREDLMHFGPLWRAVHRLAREPGLKPNIPSVAKRLHEMARVAAKSHGRRQLAATSYDGRQLSFMPEDRRAWLVSLMVPELIRRAELTTNLIPSLVPSLRFLDRDACGYEALIADCIGRAASVGLRSLATMERQIVEIDHRYKRTARSRLRLAAELGLAIPSLSRAKLAIAVKATPPGAAYLMKELGGD